MQGDTPVSAREPSLDRRHVILVALVEDAGSAAALRAGTLRVTVVTSAETAIARARSERPDAVVVRAATPDEPVLTLCRQLRDASATRLTPVVLWCATEPARPA